MCSLEHEIRITWEMLRHNLELDMLATEAPFRKISFRVFIFT